MLSPADDVNFLEDISRQVKEFYESAVVFLTQKDYSDPVYNALCSIRTALHEQDKNRLIDIIVDAHLQWLRTVNEIEQFKKSLDNDFVRDRVFQAVSFSIDSMCARLKYFQRYMDKYISGLSNIDQAELQADLEIVEEMNKEVTHVLLEKSKCFRNYICFDEFKVHVNEAIEELLQWCDKIYDGMSYKLSKYINVNIPHLKGDLTKTLQQIVDEINTERTPNAQKMLDTLKKKGKEMSSLIRDTAGHNLEINKVMDKISILDDRIKRLESEPFSAAVMALQHKKDFLERRLASLEKLKTTIKDIKEITEYNLEEGVKNADLCACPDFFQLKIFNHMLPAEDRERLVTELCYLWDLAVFGERSHKSIISILSASENREEYTDELGTFYVDEHSRKIYKLPDNDTLFQPNEHDELVPLADDGDHIYFFDECGRYFVDAKTRQRVYKAHATASEYMMDSTGVLLKVKEEREGVIYYYDNCGRYYIDEHGKHIYRDEDHVSEYENDGLGNLVRIRSHLDLFDPCPVDAHVTEDFKYLKQTVGPALRECIANVLVHQPSDPVKHLSMRLVKYRENMELKETRIREKDELVAEREIIAAEERAAAERAAMELALLTQGGSEASYDTNLLMYTTMHQDDAVSVGASTK